MKESLVAAEVNCTSQGTPSLACMTECTLIPPFLFPGLWIADSHHSGYLAESEYLFYCLVVFLCADERKQFLSSFGRIFLHQLPCACIQWHSYNLRAFGLVGDVLDCTVYNASRRHFQQVRHSATDKALKNKYVALHLQSRFIRQVEISYQIALLCCGIVRSAVFLTAYTCESCERSAVEIATSHTPVEESPKPF